MRTLADEFLISKKRLSAATGVCECTIWRYIHLAGLPAFRLFPGSCSYLWSNIAEFNNWRREWLEHNAQGEYLRSVPEIAAFSGWSAETVRAYLKLDKLPTVTSYAGLAREFWVKRSVMASVMLKYPGNRLGALPCEAEMDAGSDELHSLEEIAIFMQLSKRTVADYIKAGLLPVRRRAGRCWASKPAITAVVLAASRDPQCRVGAEPNTTIAAAALI